jgi:hypothetical protein
MNRPGVSSGPRSRVPVAVDDYDGPMGGFGTRPQGPAPGTVPRMSNPNGMSRRPDSQQKRGGAVPAVIATTLVVVLFASCFLLAQATGIGKIFASTPKVTPTVTVVTVKVPNFVGQMFADAQTQAQANHLKVTAHFVTDASHAKNLVLDQDPAADKSVAYDTMVNLTVSAGAGTATVPDVVNKDSGDACLILSNNGLTCNIPADGHQYSSTVALGNVIKTDPKAGAVIDLSKTDPTVNMWVSLGPAPATATPDVTATPTAAATKTPCPSPIPSGPTPTSC